MTDAEGPVGLCECGVVGFVGGAEAPGRSFAAAEAATIGSKPAEGGPQQDPSNLVIAAQPVEFGDEFV